MNPTASSVGLAMQCVGSASLPGHGSVSDDAERGRARHAYVAALVAGEGMESALGGVPEQWRDACDEMDVSFVPKLHGMESEVAYITDLATGVSRRVGKDLRREYGKLGPNEIAATLDYVHLSDGVVRVVDLKTGEADPGKAYDSWQLRTCALLAARFSGCRRASVEICWSPGGRKARWSSADFDELDLDSFEIALRSLIGMVSTAQADVAAGKCPPLTFGPHCRYCKAYTSCPSRMGMIRSAIASAGAEMTAMSSTMARMTSDQLTEAWNRAKPFLDAAKKLKQSFADAAMVQPFRTSDGMVYGLRNSDREEIDGPAAYAAMRDRFGDDIARKSVSLSATKASIGRGIKAAKDAGKTAEGAAKIERDILYSLRQSGGTKKVSVSKLDEHKDNES